MRCEETNRPTLRSMNKIHGGVKGGSLKLKACNLEELLSRYTLTEDLIRGRRGIIQSISWRRQLPNPLLPLEVPRIGRPKKYPVNKAARLRAGSPDSRTPKLPLLRALKEIGRA